MDDAGRVRRIERLGDLDGDVEQQFQFERLVRLRSRRDVIKGTICESNQTAY
jgi:hypothetical protein